MCELFAVSSVCDVELNDYLSEFFSHGKLHPDGWGLAVFYGNAVSLEKEPVASYSSAYLKDRLSQRILARNAMAHIRQATVGKMQYANTHPFILRDNLNRAWTLAHNGTIFHGEVLERYCAAQEGGTDSERILYYLVDLVNRKQSELNRLLTAQERFSLLDELVCSLAEGNKLNLMVYDGELLYVHTNYAQSLFFTQRNGALFFATVPLDGGQWEPADFMRMSAYRGGQLAFAGTFHGHEYKTDGGTCPDCAPEAVSGF